MKKERDTITGEECRKRSRYKRNKGGGEEEIVKESKKKGGEGVNQLDGVLASTGG